jgi:hypothetical protein
VSEEPLPGAVAPPAPLFQPIRAVAATTSLKRYAYRTLRPYTVAAVGAAGLNAIALVVLLAGVAMRLVMLQRFGAHGFASVEEATAAAQSIDHFVALTGAVSVVLRFISFIAGGFWIYNAACNIRALGAQGLEVTPGWAVGFFAVPIASLWKPFQAMEEIDSASRSPARWRAERTPLLLRFWWGAWLLSGYGGTILNLIGRGVTSLGDIAALNVALLALGVVELGSVLLYLTILVRVDRAQVGTRAGLNDIDQVFA